MTTFGYGERVDPRRVGLLLRRAMDLFNGKKGEGSTWIKGDLKQEIRPGVYGYCAAGAIREVPGFTDREKIEAQRALALLIAKGRELPREEIDWIKESNDEASFEELIFDTNDDPDTPFKVIRNLFSRAAASFGK